jgi:hypothetical protein
MRPIQRDLSILLNISYLTSNPPLKHTKIPNPHFFPFRYGTLSGKIRTYSVFYSGLGCVFRSQIFPVAQKIFHVKICFFFQKFDNVRGRGVFGIQLVSLFLEKANKKKLILPKDCSATPKCKSKRNSFSGFDWPSHMANSPPPPSLVAIFNHL